MSDFPTLRTGAILQYPAQSSIEYKTQVLQFMDGSEQRFRDFKAPLHRWLIQLELLDDSEMHQLREFFRMQRGSAEDFIFTDPWDGVQYPSCSLEDDAVAEEFVDEGKGRTSLTVRENRS